MQSLEKTLSIFVSGLVLVACLLGVVLLVVRQRAPQDATREAQAVASGGRPTSIRPQGGDDALQRPPDNRPEGPYEPWPVSFPKVLPGFFLLEDQAPKLALTPEQARQILPLVVDMAENWEQVHTVEIKIKQQLTPEQRKWITQVKHQVEQGTWIHRLEDALGAPVKGENASVVMAERICKKRMPSPIPPELAKAAEEERKRILAPDDYMQQANEEWLTVFDQCTAFFWIDEDHPDMRLHPDQAVKIYAILQDVKKPLRNTDEDFKKVCAILKPEQIAYVQDHMADLYEWRTGVRKYHGKVLTFTENPSNPDARQYHDPLYSVTISYLKEVAAAQ
jgi:hypothetical protein